MNSNIFRGFDASFYDMLDAPFSVITAARPNAEINDTCIIIRGSIRDFLSNAKFQNGVWVIELARNDIIERHTVAWDRKNVSWKYEGVVISEYE